jgi:hypothetical protein
MVICDGLLFFFWFVLRPRHNCIIKSRISRHFLVFGVSERYTFLEGTNTFSTYNSRASALLHGWGRRIDVALTRFSCTTMVLIKKNPSVDALFFVTITTTVCVCAVVTMGKKASKRQAAKMQAAAGGGTAVARKPTSTTPTEQPQPSNASTNGKDAMMEPAATLAQPNTTTDPLVSPQKPLLVLDDPPTAESTPSKEESDVLETASSVVGTTESTTTFSAMSAPEQAEFPLLSTDFDHLLEVALPTPVVPHNPFDSSAAETFVNTNATHEPFATLHSPEKPHVESSLPPEQLTMRAIVTREPNTTPEQFATNFFPETSTMKEPCAATVKTNAPEKPHVDFGDTMPFHSPEQLKMRAVVHEPNTPDHVVTNDLYPAVDATDESFAATLDTNSPKPQVDKPVESLRKGSDSSTPQAFSVTEQDDSVAHVFDGAIRDAVTYESNMPAVLDTDDMTAHDLSLPEDTAADGQVVDCQPCVIL